MIARVCDPPPYTDNGSPSTAWIANRFSTVPNSGAGPLAGDALEDVRSAAVDRRLDE